MTGHMISNVNGKKTRQSAEKCRLNKDFSQATNLKKNYDENLLKQS